MAEYSYSKILTGIRTKLEEEFQDEMSKIDFNKLAIKALKDKGIDLASLVDINQDVLIDILGEAVSRALQSDKWKSKIHRQNVDISDLIDLNGKDLDDKIKEYYVGMQKAFDKGDEQLAKSMRDSFMKAMMFSNQRNAWITNYLNDEHFEKVIGKYYDDMQKAIDKGDKQLAKSINQKIKLNESRHDWALEYQDLLTQRNSDFKLDKDEDVIIDNKKIEKGLTESAQKYQKWAVDIGHQFQELKEQAQGVGQEISNSVSNGIANQQKKVEKSLKDMIGKDQLEIVDQTRNIVRNMSDIGLTADQMREKLRLEAEEIKKGNMAFQERITLLKNNVVIDSFIGNGKSTSFDRNLLLSKEYDFLMHTHPDNEPGAYNFGNYDVGNFVFDKEFTSIFKKAELVTNGITQVILDFANMTSEQIQQFSFLYDDAEHTVRAAFGKMQEDGRIDLHGADYKEVSKYLNALGDFLIKDLGGNLQYFQKGALDPNRFKQIYDEFLQAHELLEVIDLNNGSALDDVVKSQRKVVAQAMYDNFHNSGKEIVDAMVNEATQRADEVKQASTESAKILNEAVQDGIAEGTDSHSPSKEAEKQADNVVDGFVQEINQRLPEVEKVGEKIGESVKDGIKESIKDLPSSEDDIEAYLAQLDAKVASNLDLSTKEPSIDMSDAGEEVRKNKKEVKELQQETEKAKDSMSKVMELWKEFGTPSDALDTGGFAHVREVLDYLGGKFSEMNDKADDFTERKLNAEFFRELIEQLDLSEDKLNVIKHLIFEIEAIEPGGKYEHLASNKKGQAAIINSKRSYKMLDDIRDIINGVRDVTQEEINTANLIMGIESPISSSINEVAQAEIQMGNQGEEAVDKIKESLQEVKEEFEILNNGDKRVLSDIGLTYEQLIEKLRKENKEIEEGNRLFEERVTYLKNSVVVDSFQGSEGQVNKAFTEKEYDKILHTHPVNTRGTGAFSASDILRFSDSIMQMPSFSEAELFSGDVSKVILQFKEITNSYFLKFRDFYRDLQEAINMAFGKETDYGKFIPNEKYSNETVSAYLNAIAQEKFKSLGGDLKFDMQNITLDDILINQINKTTKDFQYIFEDLYEKIKQGISESAYEGLIKHIYHDKLQEYRDFYNQNESNQSPISEEIVQTEQQLTETTEKANVVIDEQKQKISELEEQVDDLRSSLKAQGDELQHAYEEQGDLQSQLDREKGASGYLEEEVQRQEELADTLKVSVENERQLRKEAEERADVYEQMSREYAFDKDETDEKIRLETEARQEAEKQLEVQKEETEELKKKLELTEQIVNESKTKETKVDSEEVSNIKAIQNAIKKKNNAFKTEEKTVDKSVTNEINKLKELEKVISENIPNAINKKDSAFIGEKEIVKQVVDEEKKAIKQPVSKTTTEKTKPVSNDSLIKAYNVQFEKLKKAVTSDKNIITDEIKEFYETLSGKDIKLESSDAIKQYTENIKQFLDTIEKRGNETKLLKNINDATSTLQKNSAMPKRLAKDYQQLIDEMKAMSEAGGYTNKQVSEMTNRLIKLDTELARTGKSGRSFFNMIANDIKTSSARMIAMYFSFQDLIRYARSAVQAVTQLDTALTQLRVVSNASEAELRRVANSAYEMANALGSSTTEITNSITEWRRLGYTIEESQKLAEAAAKLSTGGLMDVNSATTSLISSMQAFKDMGIEAEDIVDQYIYLGK